MQGAPSDERIGVPEVRTDRLSVAQREALDEARRVYLAAGGVLDELWQPMLLRFLVAHGWSVDKATSQLQATAQWRESSGASALRRRLLDGARILELPFVLDNQQIVWYLPSLASTHEGDPISYLSLGSLRVAEWLKIIDDAQYFQYNLALQESQSVYNDLLTARGKVLVRHVLVFDCDGIGKQHLSPSAFRRLRPCMPLADLYYPEIMSCAVCLNAPWLFATIWAIIRVMLSKEMQSRVIIAPKDRTPALLARIAPMSEVPAWGWHTAFSGGCTGVPPSAAERLGYAQLDAPTRNSLLITKDPEQGGCTGFSLVHDTDIMTEHAMKYEARLARPWVTQPPTSPAQAPEATLVANVRLVKAGSAGAVRIQPAQIEVVCVDAATDL